MFGRGWFGVIAGLLMVLAIAAGVAYFAYGAGLTNGAARAEGAPESGLAAPYYYAPYRFHPFGFGYGLFGCLVPLFVFFLIFGSLRMLFWPHRWGWGPRGRRRFGHRDYEDMPEWMKERAEAWHRGMHGEGPEHPGETSV